MKLVELLAEKLEKWADTTVCYVQDPCGDVWPCKEIAYIACGSWGGDNGLIDQSDKAKHFERLDACDDHETAIVTKEQWQAERDRQKGGEWKRHRGGDKPKSVSDGDMVEVRLRCGDTQTAYADKFLWNHYDCDESVHITKYRVISQPQAEEVEYRGPFPCAPTGDAVNAIEYDIEFPSGVFTLESKTDQIDGPIKWRDTVNELDAYIEEFTREREALIKRLALEGFALLPAMTAVMGVADVDMSDPRKWKSGDLITYIHRSDSCFTNGKQYTLDLVRHETAEVETDDEGDANGWSVDYFKWHSRP